MKLGLRFGEVGDATRRGSASEATPSLRCVVSCSAEQASFRQGTIVIQSFVTHFSNLG